MPESEEQSQNTTGVARIIESGDIEDVKTILGDRDRIRYSGIIRPGIKIPKASCSEKEKKIYADLYAEGKSFDEIDEAMGGKSRTSTSKLRPSNCDYFTVRECDFRNPADAHMLMDKYADPDGKLRRVPCWFPIGDIHLVIPHNFRGFGGDGSVKCYSEYEGEKLVCHYISREEDDKARKDKRKPKFATRPCDTETCDSYKKKRCDFGGIYKVNIPGIRGMGEVIVPTGSWYGLADAIANLKRIKGVMGRFDGLFNGGTFLELCKVPETVKMPDGQKITQWIVTVEPSVDLMELARYNEPTLVAARASKAMGMVFGSPQPPAPNPTLSAPPRSIPVEPREEKTGSDPEREKAIKAIEELAKTADITMDAVKAYVVGDYCLEIVHMTIEDLREVYADIRNRIAKDKEEFQAYCNDLLKQEMDRHEAPIEGEGLPFG